MPIMAIHPSLPLGTTTMLKKIGFGIAKHPLITILAWIVLTVSIVLVALVGVGGQSLFDRLLSSAPNVSSESTTADEILAGEGKEKTEAVIITLNGIEVDDLDAKPLIDNLVADFESDSNIASVITPTSVPKDLLQEVPELQGLVSDTGIVIIVNVKQDGTDKQNDVVLAQAIEQAETKGLDFHDAGIISTVASSSLYSAEITHQASEDLKNGEIISLPLALIVLVLVFGGFLAAGMPLIGAIASIVGGMGVLYGASYVLDVDTTTLNFLSVIGLGLSIDYGLLMVSRFREVLRTLPQNDKKSVKLAVALTMDTAGKTVFFSGLTVAICTSALIFFEASIMKSIAISAGGVIVLAIFASLTLLPAMFALLGYKLIKPSILTKVPLLKDFLNKLGDVAPARGVFSWLAAKIQKAPIPIFLAFSALLLLLGSSVLSLHVSNYGTPLLSQPSEQEKHFDNLAENYDAFKEHDLTLVFDNMSGSELTTKSDAYTSLLENNNLVTAIEPLVTAEGAKYASINFDISDSKQGQELVDQIRTYVNDNGDTGDVLLTGNSARDVDFNESLITSAPIVVGIILLTTFILLFLMTGSVVIPLKAIVLSALSLGASVGVITWGFEGGNLAEILNFDASEIQGISPLILVLILVFGFGLAMDYEVFLISRIKEDYDKTKDAKGSVRRGLQGSGRIITSAGIIIVLVFLGFAFGNMLMIKQIGVALATAVLIDMTIVRCVLVPAIMTILGKHAWWAPKGLKKIHARFGIKH